MKTEVILTSNIVGLGAESDHVKVAAGYARNYLFPQRLAIPLTHANKRRLEVLKQRRAEREAHEFNTMSELAKGGEKTEKRGRGRRPEHAEEGKAEATEKKPRAAKAERAPRTEKAHAHAH